MNYRSIDVASLNAWAIQVEPQHYDFMRGYGSAWEVPFERTEAELEDGEYEPMMNYRYKLPDFKMPTNIKGLLDEAGSVTVVYFPEEDTYYLALSGGGMDLSWDICRAYILLGYLPPLDFCELPKFADMNLRRLRYAKVIQACKRSAKASVYHALRIKKDLRVLARN